MATALSLVASAFAAGLRPVPDVSVSEWADQYRIVGKPSPEEGPWRTDRVPYCREIMDNFSPASPVEITALMKAAQGAGTEILLNVLGCIMHRYPDSSMLVLPTVRTATKFVRTRLDRMIESTPAVRNVVAPSRSRSFSNTASMKEFQGSSLIITGANSGSDLRSNPVKFAFGDEIDGYPPDLDDEGDTTDLIVQRTAAFRGRKIGFVSTPTLEVTSLIYKWFLRGDQRQYCIPCPLCGHYQPLIWGADRAREGRPGGLRWPKGEPNQVQYQCEKCGDQFPEWRKIDSLIKGEWVPFAPGVGGGKIRSYKINALYYPYGWPGNAWPNLAAAWDADHRDPVKLKTFVNLKLAEPYSDPTEARADAATLAARRESYGPELPAGGCIITAGVDIQGDRIEAGKILWGPGEECWWLEYRVFPGDTSRLTDDSPYHALDAWLAAEHLSELGIPLTVRAAGVDSGYHTQIVTQFCGQRQGRKIWATKGRSGHHPVWSQKARKQRGKFPAPQIMGVDSAKAVIYARLKIIQPGPGFVHFPVAVEFTSDWFEMLTSEVCQPDYSDPKPTFKWMKKKAGARNEALDVAVNAYAALIGWQMTTGSRLEREMEKLLHAAGERIAQKAPNRTASATTTRVRSIQSDNPYL